MLDVLCAGFVCVDLTLDLPHHPAPDEKMPARGFTLSGGGPAANASVQIARLGGQSAFAGHLGHEVFAQQLLGQFAEEGIDTSLCVQTEESTPLAVVLTKPDGTRNALGYRPRVNQAAPSLHNLPGGPPRVLLLDTHRPEWIEPMVREARDLGIPVVADIGSPTEAARQLASLADHVVASEVYARSVLQTEPTLENISHLAPTGSGATIVVTRGEHGVLWQHRNSCGQLAAFSVEAIDTNGAGDAFHGAYALGLARNMAWEKLLRFASAAGALTCTKRGSWSALPRTQEVAEFLLTHSPTYP